MKTAKTREELIEVLKSVGFVWDEGQRAWMRARDGAAICEESLRDLCLIWPATISSIARAFTGSEKVAGFDMTVASLDATQFGQQFTLRFRDTEGNVL